MLATPFERTQRVLQQGREDNNLGLSIQKLWSKSAERAKSPKTLAC